MRVWTILGTQKPERSFFFLWLPLGMMQTRAVDIPRRGLNSPVPMLRELPLRVILTVLSRSFLGAKQNKRSLNHFALRLHRF